MSGKPFSMHKRGKIYYAQFRLPDGSYSNAKSTKQTTKGRAEAWAIDFIQTGVIPQKGKITLTEFSRNFFDINHPWAIDRKVCGKRITKRQCDEKTRMLKQHILPKLGHLKLVAIDKKTIKEFRNELYTIKQLSGSSVNKALSCLKSILESAEEEGIIKAVPKIERAANTVQHPRGILTAEEIKKLFLIEWEDYRAYVASMLAASSGLRMGEILALTHNDIKQGYIEINKTWDNVQYEIKQGTKTGRGRTVIIPHLVQNELENLMLENPHPGGTERLLFYKISDPYTPLDASNIAKFFKRALRKSGISEQERKERNITFHSFRHWFNSILINAKVPLLKVQALTGHSTTEMSQNYFHLDDMSDVRAIQETIFQNIEEEQE